MFGRKKKPTELLPWYRAPGYKGNLTEDQKRRLDSFRMREKHPADTYDSLPEEVKNYINKLEMEVYDNKQQSLAARCLLVSGVSAFFLARYILGYDEGSWLEYGWALGVILPWIYHHRQWRKNADEYLPSGDPGYPTREALRTEWELEYIVNEHFAGKEPTIGDPGSRHGPRAAR
jgi:hypothetical protein